MEMKHVTVVLFWCCCFSAWGQWYAYGPAVKSAEAHDWATLERQLDSIGTAFPDSVVVPMTLYAVYVQLDKQQAYDLLKPLAYRMIAYETRRSSTRFPVTTDKKSDWARREEARKLVAKGHYQLATIWFREQQYDSCLAHVDLAKHGHNYAAMHYFTCLLEQAMELAYLKSVCLEQTGDRQQARSILVPFLLLDGAYREAGPDEHAAVVKQYVHLLEMAGQREALKTALERSMTRLTVEGPVPTDSVALSLKNYEYYGAESYLIRIEDRYIPVVMDRRYWIDHPYNEGETQISESKRSQHTTGKPAGPAPPSAERAAYMEAYLRQTLLFRSL